MVDLRSIPPLCPASVHVWPLDLGVPDATLGQLASTLSPAERQRAARLYFEQDRRRFTAGRGLLRNLLGLYLGIDSEQVQLGYGPYGKPELAAPCPVRFNLSHVQDRAVFAFSWGREVGIDLEWECRLENFEQVARCAFSPKEQQMFAALAPGQRRAAFFRCWTRKEAYLKARGMGFALPLDSFTVSLAPGDPAALLASLEEPGASKRWSFQDLSPWSGYPAALAVEGQGWQVHLHRDVRSARSVR